MSPGRLRPRAAGQGDGPDGVSPGHVRRRRCHHRLASPPFVAAWGREITTRSCLCRGPGPTTASSSRCAVTARAPVRHRPGPHRHDIDGRRGGRVAGRPQGIRGVMIPDLWRDRCPTPTPPTTGLAPARAAGFPVPTTPARRLVRRMARHRIYRPSRLGATRPMWPPPGLRAFERFPAEVRGHRGRCYWSADMMGSGDHTWGGGHTTKKMAP